MSEKKIQDTSEVKAELESLIREQSEARRIFRKREELGNLIHDAESMRELAQAILERHEQILRLQNELTSTDLKPKDNQLMETFNNSILKWLQKEIYRLERIIEDMEKRHTKWKQNKQYYIHSDELAKYRLIADKGVNNKKTWELPDEKVSVQREHQTNTARAHGANLTTNNTIKIDCGLGIEPGEE